MSTTITIYDRASHMSVLMSFASTLARSATSLETRMLSLRLSLSLSVSLSLCLSVSLCLCLCLSFRSLAVSLTSYPVFSAPSHPLTHHSDPHLWAVRCRAGQEQEAVVQLMRKHFSLVDSGKVC